MTAIAYPSPNGASESGQQTAVEAWRRRALQAEAERDRWKAEADRWRVRYAWQRDLLAVPATQLSPSEKLTAIALYPLLQNQRDRGQLEPETIYIPELAQRAGVSPQTTGANLKGLEAAGGIRRTVNYDPDTKHRRVGVTATTRFFEAPSTLEPPAPRNHGGKREVCSECGSDRLTVHTRIVCEDCGAYHDEPPRPVNPLNSQDDCLDETTAATQEPAQASHDIYPVRTECTEEYVSTDSQDDTRSETGEEAAPLNGHDDHLEEPDWLPLIPGNIPDALADTPRWMTWKPEPNGHRWDKPPRNSRTGYRGSKTDPDQWGTFGGALDGLGFEGTIGVGSCLTGEDHIGSLDLDKCRNPETGEIEAWALGVIEQIPTYWEISPSGRGLRAFGEWDMPDGAGCRWKLNGHEIEVYHRDAFLTVTGHHLLGTSAQLQDCTAELAALYAQCDRAPDVPPAGNSRRRVGGSALSDEELLARARGARNGDKFCRLYDAGDVSPYRIEGAESGHHRADLALARILAFWTRDTAQIDRLFRQSALYRPKWDRRDGTYGTYGWRTIAEALT